MRVFILSEGLVVTLMVSLMQTQKIKDCEERCREVEVEKESRSLCNSFCAQLSSLPVSAFLNGHYGNSRLPKGEDQHYASEGKFPFMASLKFKVGRGMTVRHFHFCGGSAISTIYILTAAHCVVSIDIERLWVSIGDHDTRVKDTNEKLVQADKIIFHSSYDPNNFNNDIALVKLKTPFTPHNHRQIIPRMPDPMTLERAIRRGSQVTTTQIGWRRLRSGRRTQPILSYVDLPYVGLEYCKRAMGPLSISDNMLCSGFPWFGSKECAGISGGPLVYRTNPGVAPRNNNETLPLSDQSRDTSIIADHDMVLAGLVTRVGCDKPGLSVYTNVGSYAEWIENNMKYN